MELEKIGENTYYIKNSTNIGIYKINENDIYLIDTGNDKEAGKKILKIITEQGWNIKGIINTHSHADHIGGNKIIQDRTGCKIYSYGIENSFIKNTILEPSLLYGGAPFNKLKNKFLYAKDSYVEDIENNLQEGLEYISLKGHSLDMIGIKTSDDIVFLGDALFSKQTIMKYHLFYIYNVNEYLETLNILENLQAKLFILSHCEATEDIKGLIKLNRNEIDEIANNIMEYCKKEVTFEEILKYIFDYYNLNMNENQYVLVGSTIKSYLTYLADKEKITYYFKDNRMVWKKI